MKKYEQPFSYYGGKQNMLKHIMKLIPKHDIYVEAFVGGGSVFWNKEKSKLEIINDMSDNVINFYKVLKTNFDKLKEQIDLSLHSRSMWKTTREIYLNPDNYDDVTRAFAFWFQCVDSFANAPNNSWGYSKTVSVNSSIQSKSLRSKKRNFTDKFSNRLEYVDIESSDAIRIIQSRDTDKTFFYLDPPYVSSDQGHYKGYTEENFRELLELLSTIKGKFLLSSYPEKILLEYRNKFNWNVKDVEQVVSVNNITDDKKIKIECLTWNYSNNDRFIKKSKIF